MGMGRREKQRRQEELWTAHTELPRTVAHPFYEQLNRLLEARGFGEWVEQQCARYRRQKFGRRRIRGEHGKELLRRRGELLERSFAHAYETSLRRVHLLGRKNILKRIDLIPERPWPESATCVCSGGELTSQVYH